MRPRSAGSDQASRFDTPAVMRDELSHALMEALFELEVLPKNDDAALVGLYAVMDDLTEAIHRTEALDRSHAA